MVKSEKVQRPRPPPLDEVVEVVDDVDAGTVVVVRCDLEGWFLCDAEGFPPHALDASATPPTSATVPTVRMRIA
ncbi:MAG TPA: hypothetical protein VKR78_04820 [Acidimicrobiales bacterium]|nr:hypothetical protein [Acidimicrobiales bacterium]